VGTGGEQTIVLADTSVVVNLAIVDRLDLLAALAGYRFVVPQEVVREVVAQREPLERARAAGHVREVELRGIAVLDHVRELRHDLGAGEAACLALASAEGWSVACDEKRLFRRMALALIGESRLLTTPDLFYLAIQQRRWTIADADAAKAVLEQNRYRMRFGSFHDLMREKGS
jgi:predicted nucleic acid-binding protein